jgi:putative PIN family toxin of toxin-antitoxin system
VIRVVLDTNVFVSSFFGGPPREAVDLWKTGGITLCLSRPVVDEYVEVLRRLGLRNEEELGELLHVFSIGHHALFTARTPELEIVKGDPDDNKFIECAVALKADYIVTGDKHLTEIGDYMGISILSPREFLKDWDA